MTAMAGRISDYGNNFDFRSMLESKLNEKKSELGETELSIKKIGGSRLSSSTHRGVEGGGERLTSFKGRLGPVVSSRGGRPGHQPLERRTSINSRLGPRVSHSVDEGFMEENDIANAIGESNGFGGEVTGRGSVMSRIVVESKSREDAIAEQKQDKKENQRNKRIFGNILGTLQKFRADESKDKDRELKKRKIEAKIDQKTEEERAVAIKQKQELFEDKKKKELEIKVLQVQMKRAEEFEVWERSKRKEQKYIRTKTSSTKIYYLPKNHNDSTLTALENTMDEIDEEIRVARELFEEELQKISARAEQNPSASIEDLEGDDNSGDENETDRATTKSIVSAIRKPDEEKSDDLKELYDKRDRHNSQTRKKIVKLNGSVEHNGDNGEASVKDFKETNIITRNNENGDDIKADNYQNISEANPMSSEEKTNDSNSKLSDDHTNAFNKTIKEEFIVTDTKSESKDISQEKLNSSRSPVKKSSDTDEHHENNIQLKRSRERSSRSLSPNSNKRKLPKPASTKDNSKESHYGSQDRAQKKKKRDSNITDQVGKKAKLSKKRKDSSSDSSSASSSSDSQSESDRSSTNSSSYSDTSDDFTSDSDAKKKSKKSSLRNSKNKKAIKDRVKDKYSSKNQTRVSKVNRKNASKKSTNKKYTDSSD